MMIILSLKDQLLSMLVKMILVLEPGPKRQVPSQVEMLVLELGAAKSSE